MSNRGRQNVASYLALDLQLDWRQGADWFESALVDYDVCSNWGNWVAAAGMTGGRLNQFNVTKQSKDYDEVRVRVRVLGLGLGLIVRVIYVTDRKLEGIQTSQVVLHRISVHLWRIKSA